MIKKYYLDEDDTLDILKRLEKVRNTGCVSSIRNLFWDSDDISARRTFIKKMQKLGNSLKHSLLEMVRDSKKNRNTIAIIIKEMKEGEYLQVTTSKTLEIMEKIKHFFTQIVELSLKIHLVSIEDNRILRN